MKQHTNTLMHEITDGTVDQTNQDFKNAVLIVSIGLNVTILITWLALKLVSA